MTRIGKAGTARRETIGGEFSTLFERYARNEKALVAALAEIIRYRRLDAQGQRRSRKVIVATVSQPVRSSSINKGLDEALAKFRQPALMKRIPTSSRCTLRACSGFLSNVIGHQAVADRHRHQLGETNGRYMAVEMANREESRQLEGLPAAP